MSDILTKLGLPAGISCIEDLFKHSTFAIAEHEVADIAFKNLKVLHKGIPPELVISTALKLTCGDLFSTEISMDYIQLKPKNPVNVYDKKDIGSIIENAEFDAVFGGLDIDEWEADDMLSVIISSKNAEFIEWVQETAAFCHTWEDATMSHAELSRSSAGVALCQIANAVNINARQRGDFGKEILISLRKESMEKLHKCA